jgi:hypothetical protein
MLYNQLKKDLKIMDLGRKIIEGRIKWQKKMTIS